MELPICISSKLILRAAMQVKGSWTDKLLDSCAVSRLRIINVCSSLHYYIYNKMVRYISILKKKIQLQSYDGSLSQTLIYTALLLYNFFDIFMLMYFGNRIKFSGDRLSYCLFECNWIKQTSLCKNCIIILLEVLKRQHELIIGKIYRLKLETFSSVSVYLLF